MNKQIEIIQEEVSDCGICCLASIIKYYGGDISLELLRYYTSTDNLGTNAYQIIQCAKRFGFNSYGEKCEYISSNSLPLIAHLKLKNDFFHFVVVYKIDENFITVMDPSIGMKRIRVNEFYNIFTGVVIHFKVVNEMPKNKKINFFKESLIKEIKLNKSKYLLILFLSLFILMFTLINNYEIKLLTFNNYLIYLLIFIVAINELIIYIKNMILMKCNIHFNNSIIKKFVNHIFKLPLNYLKLKQQGEVTTRFNELNDLTNNIIVFIIDIIFYIILNFIILILLSLYSFLCSFIIIFISIIYLLFNIKVYNKLVNEIKYSVNLEESYNSNILDYISNFDTIKHLNIYDYFINNIDYNLKNKNVVSYSINRKVFIVNMINNIFFGVLLLFLLLFILDSNFNISNSLIIYIFINYYISNLKNIINYYPSLIVFKTYIHKLNEFLSFKLSEKIEKENHFKKINIKNLSYRINNRLILNKINYFINSKDKIFINGPSGIGKSTLMKILNNEIIKYDGKVLIDNKDIRRFNLVNLITYVSQNDTLFNDTINNNLSLGKDIGVDEINNILKLTRLDDIIKNSDLNSFLINNNSLSGGEKNRLILARSLIHSKEIIILDEVLKEVDTQLEIEIIKDLIKLYKNKTIIYISHKNVEFLFDKVLTFRKE